MKNKIPTILLTLSLTTALFGLDLKIGNEIELDAYLNARTSPDFLKYTANKEKSPLPKGTTGEVVGIKEFVNKNGKGKSGNAGIQIKITNGPRVGQTYWVYYNSKSPALKIVDKKTQKEITLKETEHSIVKIDEAVLSQMLDPIGPEVWFTKSLTVAPKAPVAKGYVTVTDGVTGEIIAYELLPLANNETLPKKAPVDNTIEVKGEGSGQIQVSKNTSPEEAPVVSNTAVSRQVSQTKLTIPPVISAITKMGIGNFPPMDLPSFERTPEGFTEEKYVPKERELASELTPVEQLKAIVIEPVLATRSIEEQVILGIAKETGSLKQDTEEILTAAERQRIEDCAKILSEQSKSTTTNEVQTPKAASDIYLPLQALEDLNSGNLKFVGRDLMPGSGQNRSCIFENEKVYVIYDNCMSSKKEAPATDIKILSKTGGVVAFYGEMLDQGNDTSFSNRKRDDYAGNWSISSTPTEPFGKMNISQIKSRMESFQKANACYISPIQKCSPRQMLVNGVMVPDSSGREICTQSLPKGSREKQTGCSSGVTFTGPNGAAVKNPNWPQEEKTKAWEGPAKEFWDNPPELWYSTQKNLLNLIKKTPF